MKKEVNKLEVDDVIFYNGKIYKVNKVRGSDFIRTIEGTQKAPWTVIESNNMSGVILTVQDADGNEDQMVLSGKVKLTTNSIFLEKDIEEIGSSSTVFASDVQKVLRFLAKNICCLDNAIEKIELKLDKLDPQ